MAAVTITREKHAEIFYNCVLLSKHKTTLWPEVNFAFSLFLYFIQESLNFLLKNSKIFSLPNTIMNIKQY